MKRTWKMMWIALAAGLVLTGHSALAGGPDAQQVKDLMATVMKAYKAPKAFSNNAKMAIEFSGEKMLEEYSSVYGANGAMEFRMPNLVIKVLDGYVYAEITGVDDSYLKRPVGSDFEKTVVDLFGGSEIVPYDYLLRSGKESGWIGRMTFGLMENGKVTGVTRGEDPEGKPAIILEVSGPNGEMRVFIDPETHFIVGADAQIEEEEAPEGVSAQITMTMLPKTYEKLPKPITFVPGDRKAVDSIEDLLPKEPEPVAQGKLAPDFTLPQYKGTEVTLSKLRGKIVVLDFWATWCGPCRKGLPSLQEFSAWANKNTDDVVVYAVNVWERARGEAAITELVADFWEKNKYTMPTLISMNDKITRDYGVSGIPVTVVIDQQGRIAKTHRGYSPNMLEQLKKEVEALRDSS